MTLIALLLALAAFLLLALATDAHALTRLGSRPSPRIRRARRGSAWMLLALAFVLSIAARGWIFGPVLWIALVMLSAGAVFLTLNFLPPKMRIR